jgi:flagellar biosynthesis protein
MAAIRKKGSPLEPPAEKEKKTAIAVKYEPDKDRAPLVLAVGKGSIAEEILKIAEENNIPLFEDQNLAQLLSKIEINMEIPPQLYTLVAEVLSYIYRLDQMATKRKKVESSFKKGPAGPAAPQQTPAGGQAIPGPAGRSRPKENPPNGRP